MLQKWRWRTLRIDKKQATLSLLLLIGLVLPFTYVHEFGHVLVCWFSGVAVTAFNFGSTTCAFDSINLLYYAFGGIFASMVALAPLAVKQVRANKGIVVVLLALSTYNGYNAGLETFTHDTYVTLVQGWNVTYAMSNALMFLGIYLGLFLTYLTKKSFKVNLQMDS